MEQKDPQSTGRGRRGAGGGALRAPQTPSSPADPGGGGPREGGAVGQAGRCCWATTPIPVHTLAPAGLIRDLDAVIQLGRGHGEGAGRQHGPPAGTPAVSPLLGQTPPGHAHSPAPVLRCPIPEPRSVTSLLATTKSLRATRRTH